MKKNKLVKTAMISAIALSPVLAVGVNVNNVNAAAPANLTTGEITAIHDFYVAYSGLSSEKKKLVEIIFNNVGSQPTYTLESAYSSQIGSQYTSLLNISPDMTEEQFQNKYSSFKSSVAAAKPDVTSADLVSFFNTVFVDLKNAVNNLQSSQYSNLAGTGIYQELLDVYNDSNMPTSLDSVLKAPTPEQASQLITNIQTQFNNYLNPGPGPGPGPVDPNEEIPSETIESNPQAVIDAINAAKEVDELVIELTGTDSSVSVPVTIVNALNNKNEEAVIIVANGSSSYELPIEYVNVLAIAEQLNVASSELKLVISMNPVTNPLANNASYEVLSGAFDFSVTLVSPPPNSQSVAINVFPKPVTRSILTTNSLDTLTTVGVTVDAQGNVKAVPTFVADKEVNLHRSGNSVYTLIKNFKTFNDVNNGVNWSEPFVEKLASRMIVNGTTGTTFEPNRDITRGEFAAILSRGLGLVPKNKAVKFSDVSSKQAFNTNGEIAAVVEAGIVKGDAKGKFRPYDEISRDEAAIMISRALDFIGAEGVKFDTTKKVSNFTDYRYIGNTARPHVQKVYQAGYINGYSNGTFGASDETERGQMAKILYNFLQSVKFIN
ncbi:S-layer homology domain-containing protein [Paenisporosarcina sp.]|uniref:S-layer homology domain-containing protein n=1 Tax=Paenisporosarcina sp. TaxID=1932001 RepID=UPI003C768B21